MWGFEEYSGIFLLIFSSNPLFEHPCQRQGINERSICAFFRSVNRNHQCSKLEGVKGIIEDNFPYYSFKMYVLTLIRIVSSNGSNEGSQQVFFQK